MSIYQIAQTKRGQTGGFWDRATPHAHFVIVARMAPPENKAKSPPASSGMRGGGGSPKRLMSWPHPLQHQATPTPTHKLTSTQPRKIGKRFLIIFSTICFNTCAAPCFICAALWADPAARSTASPSTSRTAAPGRRTARWRDSGAAGRAGPPAVCRHTASRRWGRRSGGSSDPPPPDSGSRALRCTPYRTWLKMG